MRTHAHEGTRTQERGATEEHRTTDDQTANHRHHWERRRSVQGGELNRGPTRNQQTTNTPPAVTRETTPGPMPTTKQIINMPPATSFRANAVPAGHAPRHEAPPHAQSRDGAAAPLLATGAASRATKLLGASKSSAPHAGKPPRDAPATAEIPAAAARALCALWKGAMCYSPPPPGPASGSLPTPGTGGPRGHDCVLGQALARSEVRGEHR